MARGNKAIWEKTINISCQFTYSFLTFSYILLAYRFYQYVSCIYYIYLYISTIPPLGTSLGLNEGLSGDRGFPNPTNGNSYILSSVPQATWFCWGD